jgi:transcriptional repressor NrdR
MQCPYCLHHRTKVTDKRDIADMASIRRRRECLSCGRRFTTYERVVLSGLRVVKKDGRVESFDRDKLIAGCLKACEKRPIPRERIETLVQEIEAALRARDMSEMPARAIGSIVMEKLQQLDSVAYMRFASVYREFETLDSFETELKRLKKVR